MRVCVLPNGAIVPQGSSEPGRHAVISRSGARRGECAQRQDVNVKPADRALLRFYRIRMTTQTFTDPIEAILAQLEEPSAPRGWEVIHQLRSFPSSEEMAFRSTQKLRVRTVTHPVTGALEIHKDEKRVVVEYEYESAAGRVEKMRVTFADVLALGYREIAFPIDGELKGAREVRSVAQS